MAPKTQPHKGTERHPFLLSVEDVANQLETNIETGLTARKVAELQKNHPPNELEGGGGISWYKILIKQISNAMILVCCKSLRIKVLVEFLRSSEPLIISHPPLTRHSADIETGSRIRHGFELWSWRLH